MKTCITFAIAKANKANAKAQMAELVDALVSNTSGVTSMPVRSRLWVLQTPDNQLIIRGFLFIERTKSVLPGQRKNGTTAIFRGGQELCSSHFRLSQGNAGNNEAVP